jgi:hypothetical protein
MLLVQRKCGVKIRNKIRVYGILSCFIRVHYSFFMREYATLHSDYKSEEIFRLFLILCLLIWGEFNIKYHINKIFRNFMSDFKEFNLILLGTAMCNFFIDLTD